MRDLLVVVGFSLAYASGLITGWVSNHKPRRSRIRIEIDTNDDIMEQWSDELRRRTG